ncbi:MAG: hypothetical protein JNK33_04895 [Candidatus Doudnabacteria bacterium]|nr:hypothetical protein [Candidatus Doudnabacteria bacterium]
MIIQGLLSLYKYFGMVSWLGSLLNKPFFQTIVTGIAIYYAVRIGNKQNLISDQLFRLEHAVSVLFTYNDGLFRVSNQGRTNVYLVNLRVEGYIDETFSDGGYISVGAIKALRYQASSQASLLSGLVPGDKRDIPYRLTLRNELNEEFVVTGSIACALPDQILVNTNKITKLIK